jgi:hypothetical protein
MTSITTRTGGHLDCRAEFIRPNIYRQAKFGNYFRNLIPSKPLLQALPELGDLRFQVGDALFEFRHTATG